MPLTVQFVVCMLYICDSQKLLTNCFCFIDLVFLEDMDRLVNSTAHHSQSKFNRRHQNFQVGVVLCLKVK